MYSEGLGFLFEKQGKLSEVNFIELSSVFPVDVYPIACFKLIATLV